MMTMQRTWLATALMALALPAHAANQTEFLDAGGRSVQAVAGNACAGGLRYDDGSYEGAVGFANAVPNGAYVMGFDLPAGYTAESVCLCWTRTNASTGTAVDFDVVFYAADGVGPKGEPGWPGTLIDFVPARAENVPEFNTEGVAMYPVPIPDSVPQPLPSRVYVGALWRPFDQRQFYICNDATPETALNEAFNSIDGVAWSPTSEVRPTYRALGTVLFGTTPPPAPVPLPIAALGIGLGMLGIGAIAIARSRRKTRTTR